MGEVATTLLLRLIESKHPVKDFETRVLPAELIIRESTKRLIHKENPGGKKAGAKAVV